MIKHGDFQEFKGQYPYASELFGTYQTLIGWRGERAKGYMEAAFARERRAPLAAGGAHMVLLMRILMIKEQ